MDVARISAISPRKIDWRSLTAKEIIKYDNEGVAVPVQYLSWAQEFSASLHSEDKTTYEMANSGVATDTTAQAETPEDTEIINDENTTSTNESETPVTANQHEKLTAEDKLNSLVGENKNIISIGLIFREESKLKESETKSVTSNTDSIQENEVNEIANLESYMSSLITEIDNLKNEINNISDKDDNITQIAKANRLQEQIDKLGNAGQQTLTSTDNQLQNFENILNQNFPIADEANDYGGVTINIGNAIKNISFWGHVIGNSVKKAGENATAGGKHLTDAINSALNTNAQNQSTVNSHQNELADKSGVMAISTAKTDTKAEENQTTKEQQASEKDSDEQKQNEIKDNTDLNGKLTTDLNEILKRKIRKGENIDNPTV